MDQIDEIEPNREDIVKYKSSMSGVWSLSGGFLFEWEGHDDGGGEVMVRVENEVAGAGSWDEDKL